MEKKIIVLVFIIYLFFPTFTYAETLVLKSGKTIEGNLIEKTDNYIKIEFMDVPLTYYFNEIESINGERTYYLPSTGIFKIMPPEGFSKVTESSGEVMFEDLNDNSILKIAFKINPRDAFIGKFDDEKFRENYIKRLADKYGLVFVSSGERKINGLSGWEFTSKKQKQSGLFIFSDTYLYDKGIELKVSVAAKEGVYDNKVTIFNKALDTLEVLGKQN